MIILCVTGSIAATESVKLAREFIRNDVDVKCFMSDAACEIIHPNAMEFATGNSVVTKLTGEIEFGIGGSSYSKYNIQICP